MNWIDKDIPEIVKKNKGISRSVGSWVYEAINAVGMAEVKVSVMLALNTLSQNKKSLSIFRFQ